MGSTNTGGKENSGNNAAVSDALYGELLDPKSRLYTEGEKILVDHGPLLYEAKIQSSEIRNKEWRYLVHYLGWNKNWDEWLGVDRLMKYTAEPIQKYQALKKKQGAEKHHKSGCSMQTKPNGSTDANVDKEDVKNNVAKGKKRKADEGRTWDLGSHHHPPPCYIIQRIVTNKSFNKIYFKKESISAEKFVKIQIPSTLKKQLVDDWEYVVQKDKLVKLPCSPNVEDVMRKYVEYRKRKDGTISDSVATILNGLRCYFNRALPLMLLYKIERQQYSEVVTGNGLASTVYGAEHLLRLFVKLPELLAYVNVEENIMTYLQQKLVDFLRFLQKNQSALFLSVYECSNVTESTTEGNEN